MIFRKSAYLAKKLLNHVLLGENYSPPATVYIALLTSNPTRLGNMSSEVSGGGYSRLQLIVNPAVDDIETSLCDSIYDLEWPQATAAWGTITHGAIMDAQTGGNMLYFAELTDSQGNPAPQEILLDNFFKFPAGVVVVEEG